jgi:tetratricopeptide (TPR) repeat protein
MKIAHRIQLALAFACALGPSSQAKAAPADLELDRASEPVLSSGVVALSRSEFSSALSAAESILRAHPICLKALELKALAQKGLGSEMDALATYQLAARAIVRELKSRDGTAPYVFEIGLIRLHLKQRQEARDGFQFALEHGFNVPAAHFFLGTLDLEDGDLLSAEAHFREVLSSNVEDLRPSAAYYLGQILGKENDGVRSARNYLLARSLSSHELADPGALPETRQLAGKILTSVKPLIEPLAGGHWFGNFAMLTAYDSNVLDVPASDISGPSGSASQASFKEALRFGLGYATSALNSIQFVPSYQGGVNYDFNQATSAGEFFTHDLEIYLTKDALASTSWGLKLEGVGIMQWQTDPSTGNSAYAPYSLTGLAGPYFRKETAPKVLLTVELYAGATKNYTDPNVSTVFQRTGPQELLRTSLRQDTRETYWNPGIALTLEAAQPLGDEFKSQAATVQVNDRLFFGDNTSIGASIDLGWDQFLSRPGPARYDKLISGIFNIVQNLSAKWSLLGNVQALENFSNIQDTYQYSRVVVATGVGFSF